MTHFIIPYRVMLNNAIIESGLVGIVIPASLYNSKKISELLEKEYMERYPGVRFVYVTLERFQQVTRTEYWEKSRELFAHLALSS